MYSIETSNKFEKEFKKCIKRNYDISLLENIVFLLEESGELPIKHKPHKLIKNYAGYWECHIKPDWLLIYKIDETNKIITLARTGTHSDLF
jgi:mRNA interferase YafQ